jgi:hypothetical protein
MIGQQPSHPLRDRSFDRRCALLPDERGAHRLFGLMRRALQTFLRSGQELDGTVPTLIEALSSLSNLTLFQMRPNRDAATNPLIKTDTIVGIKDMRHFWFDGTNICIAPSSDAAAAVRRINKTIAPIDDGAGDGEYEPPSQKRSQQSPARKKPRQKGAAATTSAAATPPPASPATSAAVFKSEPPQPSTANTNAYRTLLSRTDTRAPAVSSTYRSIDDKAKSKPAHKRPRSRSAVRPPRVTSPYTRIPHSFKQPTPPARQ